MEKNRKTVLLVGGGTGGHIQPISDIYEKLKKENLFNLTVVGSGGVVEKEYFKDVSDYRSITAGKFRRQFTTQNFAEGVFFLVGIIESYFLLRKVKPDIIFSKGGFVTVPVIFWAKLFKIPYFIHESDLVMGYSNRMNAKRAKKVFVGFPTKFYPNLPSEKLEYTGQIIREHFIRNKSVEPFRFGFSFEKPTIFITGGSQGSRRINETVLSILPKLLMKFNVIHQTGFVDITAAEERKKTLSIEAKKSYFTKAFLDNEKGVDLMTEAINLADMVVARAGANSIAELAIKSKPMLVIPYKYSAGGHQQKNADLLKIHRAAIVLVDDELTEENLLFMIYQLFSNLPVMIEMGKNANKLFPSNGLEIVTNAIKKSLIKN